MMQSRPALDAAARSKVSPIVVCVASGTFPEQLNITSRGGISLVGRGTWKNPTILEPKSVIVNNYDNILGGAFAQAAIILAGNNGTSAIIRNINVRNIVINGDGARSSINKYPICYADFAGINFDGASGAISNNTIKNMYMPLAQDACGDGGGIDVDINNNLSLAESVTVSNNLIPNYGEFGIGCWGALQRCTITGNKVSFYSPYATTTSPAGIAILGALAEVTNNVASGNVCTASYCGPSTITQGQGEGILTVASVAGTMLKDNSLNDNNFGIGTYSDSTTVVNNKITGSTFAAVVSEDGSGTYNIIGNCFSENPIGTEVVNAGVFTSDSTPFTTNLVSNSYEHVPIRLEIITFSPGSAIVNFQGHTHVVSGNATVIIK